MNWWEDSSRKHTDGGVKGEALYLSPAVALLDSRGAAVASDLKPGSLFFPGTRSERPSIHSALDAKLGLVTLSQLAVARFPRWSASDAS